MVMAEREHRLLAGNEAEDRRTTQRPPAVQDTWRPGALAGRVEVHISSRSTSDRHATELGAKCRDQSLLTPRRSINEQHSKEVREGGVAAALHASAQSAHQAARVGEPKIRGALDQRVGDLEPPAGQVKTSDPLGEKAFASNGAAGRGRHHARAPEGPQRAPESAQIVVGRGKEDREAVGRNPCGDRGRRRTLACGNGAQRDDGPAMRP